MGGKVGLGFTRRLARPPKPALGQAAPDTPDTRVSVPRSALRFSPVLEKMMTEQTNPLNTLFDRIDAAAKLSRQLSGKTAARTVCEAFVSERLADLQTLQRSGVPLARYARLIAPRLGVRPAALLDAVRRAGLSAAVSAPRSTAEAKSPPAGQPPAAKPSASSVPSLAPSGVPGLELPPWADGSDRLPEESEADYILRKNLETPPDERRKFIGES